MCSKPSFGRTRKVGYRVSGFNTNEKKSSDKTFGKFARRVCQISDMRNLVEIHCEIFIRSIFFPPVGARPKFEKLR